MTVLGFVILVALASAVARADRCMLTQRGRDGFGHQYEGKLSCILAAQLDPRYEYVHMPFLSFEHIRASGESAEQFTNISFGQKLAPLDRSFEVTNFHALPSTNCSEEKVYVIDNCWPLIYFKPHVHRLRQFLPIIQEPFHSSAHRRPVITYPNRSVVVVHIRRTDALWRKSEEAFFVRAMRHFQKFTFQRGDPPPYFVVVTDDPEWGHLHIIRSTFNGSVEILGPSSEDLYDTFTRMATSYGLVLAYSSLSFCGVLINPNLKLALMCRICAETDASREEWLHNSDFVQLI